MSTLLDESFPTIRKCVHCVTLSTTTPPCLSKISPSTFLGISNVPVMQNETHESFPSITFFLISKSPKWTPRFLRCSSTCLLLSFENRVSSEMIVSSPIHLIDVKNSLSVRSLSRSSSEKFFFSLYQRAMIASTMICAVFFPICWIPSQLITLHNGLFFDFLSSSVMSTYFFCPNPCHASICIFFCGISSV